MKTAKNAIIIAASVIILSTAFIFVLANFSDKPQTNEPTPVFTQEESAEKETVDVEDSYSFKNEGISKKETTTKNAQNTVKEETTKKENSFSEPETTKPSTTKAPETTDSRTNECYNSLLEGYWYMEDGTIWSFCANGMIYVYDSNWSYIDYHQFEVYRYTVYVYDNSGNLINKFEYDPATDSLDSYYNYSEPETTAYTSGLNDSNAYYHLAESIRCYDSFINTNSFGFEFSYGYDYIVCPHCEEYGYTEYAYPVTNFSSIQEMYDYIDENLTGSAACSARSYLEDSISYGFITESNGKLYVCPMYNEKGYVAQDPATVSVVGSSDDGSYVIEVEDYDGYSHYYIVVYENGSYKITSVAYMV